MKNIHKHVHMPHMYTAAFLGSLLGLAAGLSGIFPSSAASFATAFLNLVGTYGNPHVLGVFDQTPAGGNFGKITLIAATEEATVGGSGLYLDTTTLPYQTLTGSFFSETMGWFTIIKGDIIPPANMNVMTPWQVDGAAWSDTGGMIEFVAQDATYSGVAYIPGTQTFTGYAWSNSGGYLPFGGMTAEFRNRVKILGNIGGAKSFDTEYALGTKFDAVNTTSMINTVRKNVSLITRSSTQVNTINTTTKNLNGVVYYKNSGYDFVVNKVNASNIGSNRALIVEGGDIIITGDVANGTTPKALIAIKDAAGKGGNIYIRGDVKNIYASLIAEGTVYSGESSANIYNDTTAELTQLPKNQLYILGSVISRNTIGGSAKSPAICPFSETNCTYISSFAYDWNYFRTYDGKVPTKSVKNGYDNYSVIIESDPRMTANPPPGLTQ